MRWLCCLPYRSAIGSADFDAFWSHGWLSRRSINVLQFRCACRRASSCVQGRTADSHPYVVAEVWTTDCDVTRPGRVTSVVAAKSGARRSSRATLEATAALASMAPGDVPRVRRARVGEFTRAESPRGPTDATGCELLECTWVIPGRSTSATRGPTSQRCQSPAANNRVQWLATWGERRRAVVQPRICFRSASHAQWFITRTSFAGPARANRSRGVAAR
jgi:hypothetical protein